MFHRLNTGAELVGGLSGIHSQPALQNAWTTVEFFGHKVHCAAVPFFPCVEHSLVRVQPGVCRQQGRVDVQYLSFVMLYKPGAQDAHESSEHDKVWLVSVENAGNRAIERLSVRIVAMVQALGSNARSLCPRQSISIRFVAEDNAEVEINLALCCFIDE